MPFGTITSTENTFGSISGTVGGSVPGTLTGSVGVPGPQGPAGSQGPTGPAGAAGQGVPAGGTTGQFLAKTSNTDYATAWTNIDLTAYRSLTNFDFTNVADAPLNTFGVLVQKTSGMPEALYNTYLNGEQFNFEQDYSFAGTVAGQLRRLVITPLSVGSLFQVFSDVDGTIIPGDGVGFLLDSGGLRFKDASGGQKPNSIRYDLSSIVFGDNSTQTTAFPGFNNAALTGNPTAPTATFGDNDTSIATTAFVQAGLLGGTANARNLEVQVRNQSGSTVPAGSIVYISGATGNLPLITLAQANNDANSAQTIGFVKTSIANNGTGYVIVRGVLENIDTSALTEGVQLYLSPTVAGSWTTTKPSAPQHLVYVGVVIRSHPTLGTILVAVQNGYELHELHDVALSSEANNDLLAYESSTDLWKNKSASALGIATESFVTSQGYITAAGVPAFATNAQAQTGSSTTTVMSPSTVQYAKSSPSYFRFSGVAVSVAQSGSGAVAQVFLGGCRSQAPTSAIGYGNVGFNITYHSRGSGAGITTPFPWNRRFVAQFRYNPRSLGTDSNTVNRILFGKVSGSTTGDLTLRGVGIRQVANGPLQLVVHDGTTFTAVNSSFTPVTTASTDIRIVSDGAGNVTLFSNDVQIATTSAGPTTAGTTVNAWMTIESENLSSITGTANSQYVGEISAEFSIT